MQRDYIMLLVSAGTLKTAPSNSLVTLIWQHSLDLWKVNGTTWDTVTYDSGYCKAVLHINQNNVLNFTQ